MDGREDRGNSEFITLHMDRLLTRFCWTGAVDAEGKQAQRQSKHTHTHTPNANTHMGQVRIFSFRKDRNFRLRSIEQQHLISVSKTNQTGFLYQRLHHVGLAVA